MSDEVIAGSKAVEKTAEFGTETVKASEKLGAFIARVFKEPLDQVSGMLTDNLKFKRWKRLVAIAEEVDEIIAERGIPLDSTRFIPPKLALPIFESASLEEDETLQDLWVQLLANAMDPSSSVDLQPAFIEIAKSLRPCEAKLLSRMYNTLKINGATSSYRASALGFSERNLGYSPQNVNTEFEISIDNLKRLRCVEPMEKDIKFGKGLRVASSQKVTVHDSDRVVMTALGMHFVRACLATEKATPKDSASIDIMPYNPPVEVETEVTNASFLAH